MKKSAFDLLTTPKESKLLYKTYYNLHQSSIHQRVRLETSVFPPLEYTHVIVNQLNNPLRMEAVLCVGSFHGALELYLPPYMTAFPWFGALSC